MLKRLRINLALEVRTPALGERPHGLAAMPPSTGRIVINPDHEEFAPLLAEALDVIADRQGHLHSSAEQLRCTPSQLQKFLHLEPRAWSLVNHWRRQQGCGNLRLDSRASKVGPAIRAGLLSRKTLLVSGPARIAGPTVGFQVPSYGLRPSTSSINFANASRHRLMAKLLGEPRPNP